MSAVRHATLQVAMVKPGQGVDHKSKVEPKKEKKKDPRKYFYKG